MNSIITKDFNGLPIVFRKDGYINMTKAAKHFGKKLSNFFDSPTTKEYMKELLKMPGFQVIKLVITKKGRNGETWVHPKMAVFVARWLSIPFAVWCDLMIDNILKGALQVSVAVPTKEALELKVGKPHLAQSLSTSEFPLPLTDLQTLSRDSPQGCPVDLWVDAMPYHTSKNSHLTYAIRYLLSDI